MQYRVNEIDQKAKAFWKEQRVYQVSNDTTKPKCYVLDMFPYPSGAGLHVGHPLGYVASDIYARYKRMQGFNVLHPMGFDSFGLPTEQYAIETGIHPKEATDKNIATYKKQIENIGYNYDWDREVVTSDPNYFKWTQWIFLELFGSIYCYENKCAYSIDVLIKHFEAHGNHDNTAFTNKEIPAFSAAEWNAYTEKEKSDILMSYRLAYVDYAEVNWCEALGTVLANDEVINGRSERGGHPVVKKQMRQWFLRISAYADRLLNNLEFVDFSPSLKEMQRNWIGKSEGALVDFAIENHTQSLRVFTTRPDTIFGSTFMVIAPEHPLVSEITTEVCKSEVEAYLTYCKSRNDIDRQAEKKVTGAFTGSYAVHPFNGKKLPIYIAEYVLMGYGTGAIMAVPAEDERDSKFAEKFGIEIIQIFDKTGVENPEIGDKKGTYIHSDFLNGLGYEAGKMLMLEKIETLQIGTRKVQFRLRDAGFSRQRYWGEPIPIIWKDEIAYPLPFEELPLVNPDVDVILPTNEGKSPLARNTAWVHEKEGYTRETDTMPAFAGSSWYFLRYMDNKNEKAFVNKELATYWNQVDVYVGGTEHAVGHLLYSRFFNNFLYDRGYISFEEPYKKLINQGMIQGVSAFVYRAENLAISSCGLAKENAIFPNLFFSKDDLNKILEIKNDKIKRIRFDESGVVLVSVKLEESRFEMNEEFHKLYSNILNLFNKFSSNIEMIEFDIVLSPIHIHISLIDEITNEVDLEGLRKWKKEFENAIFLTNNDKFICGRETEKMSKSKYNVVNPDVIIEKYGADCFRMYEMFLGPIELSKPWNTAGIEGVSKFLRRFWNLYLTEEGESKVIKEPTTKEELKTLHKLLKKLHEDINNFSFNTSVSAFMIAVNELQTLKCAKYEVLEPMIKAICPFAPHTAEMLWQAIGGEGSVIHASFPNFDASILVENDFEYPVSINGKMRVKISLPLEMSQDDVQAQVLANETVQKWLEGNAMKKFIFVKGRMINVVV
jgi:leucyl-tRNA synthetase